MATISGTAGNDVITNSTGHDMIFASGGNDYVDGGTWNDTIYGGNGADTIIGGTGVDSLYGDADNDTFFIDDKLDYYAPYKGDLIDGGSGTDQIITAPQSTTGSSYTVTIGEVKYVEIFTNGISTQSVSLQGSGKIDLSGITTVNKGGGIGTIFGASTNDEIKGFNQASFGDNIWASSGNDTVYGYAGNDRILGGDGDDYLVGGVGNDTLVGHSGLDTFVFNDGVNEGADVIDLFVDGSDKIRFTSGVADFSSLAISDGANGCLIETASGSSITLLGISSSLIGAEDFIFG